MTAMDSSAHIAADSDAADPGSVLVWDIWVRLFHWSLVACVVANFVLLEEGKEPHQWVGYLATALVLARVIWGFIGSRHARFASFFPTPQRLRAYWADLRRGRHEVHLGHNPLGALMMLVLVTLVLALGATGYLQGLDAFWGEEWLEELHEALANGLVLLAGVHALAALVMGRLERTNLVAAMVTGRKRMRSAARQLR
jgi:cytochrome b